MKNKQLIVVIVVLSVSLAYFTTQIIGAGKKTEVGSTNLQIVFTNTDGAISGASIEQGWSATKTFTIKNDSKSEYKYNIVIKDLVNTFVTKGYLQYKITSTNNGYNMTDYKDIPKSATAKDKILAYSVAIPARETQTYTIEFKYSNDKDVDQDDDMGKVLNGTLFITEGTEDPYAGYEEGTLGYQIMGDNIARSTRSNNNNGTNDFATPLTTTTTGTLFKSTESIAGSTPKEVYYYAGNTTNNWVKFANLYWRIIRTNADGSIRLLYVGTSHDTTSGNIGTSAFNTSYNSPKYVGYKYGEDTSLDTTRNNTTDSTIKTFIDLWYQNNLINYTKYLSASAVYCNDRSERTGQKYSASSDFNFASYYRMDFDTSGAAANPTYNCTDIRDAFSVDNTSAKLDYPIALMTADEIAFAGGVVFQKMSTPYAWFISNSAGSQVSTDWWWSLSPVRWVLSRAGVWRWYSFSAHLGGNGSVNLAGGVRPAVSLKSCVKYSKGNGIYETPYEIEETSTGC